MISHILRDLIDAGVVAYIDDILIYSKTEEEHIELVKEVLRRLSDNNLAIEPEKCDWHVSRVDFLGYVISEQGIEMSDEKVESVKNWETPENVKDIQSFLGFANFYRRFIEGYSKLTRPMTDLTKKSEKFVWTDECCKDVRVFIIKTPHVCGMGIPVLISYINGTCYVRLLYTSGPNGVVVQVEVVR